MNTTTKKALSQKQGGGKVNPFARALAETEQGLSAPQSPQGLSKDQNSMFSQALAGANGGDKLSQNMDPDALRRQQEEAEKQRKKELMRKKLHDQVNPVDMIDVFNNREKKVKEEIEKVRKELKMLAQEIAALHKDVDIAVTQEVVNPGQDGAYYLSFFQKLRAFIMLLRKKIKSARTWAQQVHSKKSKKKKRRGRKGSAGIEVGGAVREKGKAVHDMMHHEQSTVYSGG